MTRTYIAIALLFIVGTFFRLFRAQIKGWFGETLLDNLLKFKLDSTKFKILHNIMLPTVDGATTQIDHIVVSEWGIFVIETKTYSGWVFGDANSPQWTVSHFKRKDRFQNPLRQNYKHIATLSECLGIPKEYFKTIVAFGGETDFKTQMPPEVMLFGDVPDYIHTQSVNAIIKAEQVPEIVDAIMEWQASLSRERKAAHVENLRRNHPVAKARPDMLPKSSATPEVGDDSPPTCPKCGATMVRRTRKSDGGQFWGCSKYPKCKGILQ